MQINTTGSYGASTSHCGNLSETLSRPSTQRPLGLPREQFSCKSLDALKSTEVMISFRLRQTPQRWRARTNKSLPLANSVAGNGKIIRHDISGVDHNDRIITGSTARGSKNCSQTQLTLTLIKSTSTLSDLRLKSNPFSVHY